MRIEIKAKDGQPLHGHEADIIRAVLHIYRMALVAPMGIGAIKSGLPGGSEEWATEQMKAFAAAHFPWASVEVMQEH